MTNYKTTAALHDLQDRINIWVRHHMQPRAYSAGTVSLSELAAMLTVIANAHGSDTQ